MEKKLPQKNTFISLTDEEQGVRAYLVEFAHKTNYRIKPYVFYSDLCVECRLKLDMNNPNDRTDIGRILGSVSSYEISHNRPVLSSLVVSKTYEQGDGFYKLCAEEFPELGSWIKQKDDRVDIKMTDDCITFWNDDKNYNENKGYKEPTKAKRIVLNNEEKELRDFLVDAASKGRKVFYSELVDDTNDYQIERLTKMLEKISRIEHDQKRPFLCALVITKRYENPGSGFFVLCKDMDIKKSVDVLQQECFDYWKNKHVIL